MNAHPDFKKRTNHREAILRLLSDGKQHHMTEMEMVGGMRFGARVFELRKKGFAIETMHIGADETCYRLIPSGQLELLK